MDPALAVSAMLAKYRADVAMSMAARMMQMDADAARTLVDTITESAETLEKVAAETAAGVGDVLDVSV